MHKKLPSETDTGLRHKGSTKKLEVTKTQSAPENTQKTLRKASNDVRQKEAWVSVDAVYCQIYLNNINTLEILNSSLNRRWKNKL